MYCTISEMRRLPGSSGASGLRSCWSYWAANARSKIEKRIRELAPELPKYDVIPVIESYLGFSLHSHTITVYLLAYSEPHGIRITGLRFLTHVSYPFGIVLHNAIHEPMHPPYHSDDP